jgi:hypothetical protein
MARNKTIRIFEVLHDTDSEGPAADGTQIARFDDESEAKRFAAAHTVYGRPASVLIADVPRSLAERWGF